MEFETFTTLPLMFFQGTGYFIKKPTMWLISMVKEHVVFVGPKIGLIRASFMISQQKDGQLHNIASNLQKKMADELIQYQLLDEQDLSNNGINALMRYHCYYRPDIDSVIYKRQIFYASLDSLYLLSGDQPNNPALIDLDSLYAKMFASFRIGQLY